MWRTRSPKCITPKLLPQVSQVSFDNVFLLKCLRFKTNVFIGLVVTVSQTPQLQVFASVLDVTEPAGLILSNVCNLMADQGNTLNRIWIVVRPRPKGNNVSDRNRGSATEHLNANGIESCTSELGERVETKTNLYSIKIDAWKIRSQSALIARRKAVMFRRIWDQGLVRVSADIGHWDR